MKESNVRMFPRAQRPGEYRYPTSDGLPPLDISTKRISLDGVVGLTRGVPEGTSHRECRIPVHHYDGCFRRR